METETKTHHIGRKIARIRELQNMKQETLAEVLGVSQQSVSALEQSETLEETKLQKVAQALGVSKEAINKFSEESVFSYFNNFHDNSGFHTHCTFNPIDKIVDLYEEKERLFERLLNTEKEKVSFLEQLLKDLKKD